MSVVLIDGGTITVLPESTRAMTVHNGSQCAGRTCVVHAPTAHHMRGWPLHWRADRGIFERLCEHHIGHPDPDQRDYWHELAASGLHGLQGEPDNDYSADPDEYVSAQMVHGCCGCCTGTTS